LTKVEPRFLSEKPGFRRWGPLRSCAAASGGVDELSLSYVLVGAKGSRPNPDSRVEAFRKTLLSGRPRRKVRGPLDAEPGDSVGPRFMEPIGRQARQRATKAYTGHPPPLLDPSRCQEADASPTGTQHRLRFRIEKTRRRGLLTLSYTNICSSQYDRHCCASFEPATATIIGTTDGSQYSPETAKDGLTSRTTESDQEAVRGARVKWLIFGVLIPLLPVGARIAAAWLDGRGTLAGRYSWRASRMPACPVAVAHQVRLSEEARHSGSGHRCSDRRQLSC
jgi:hypothetical protein